MLTVTVTAADGATALAQIGIEGPNAQGGFVVGSTYDTAVYDSSPYD